MNEHEGRRLAQVIIESAGRAYRGDPHWRSYLAAHVDREAMAVVLPDLVQLAATGRRDGRVRALLDAMPNDLLVIAGAGAGTMTKDRRRRQRDRETARQIADLVAWHATDRPPRPGPPDDGLIPF